VPRTSAHRITITVLKGLPSHLDSRGQGARGSLATWRSDCAESGPEKGCWQCCTSRLMLPTFGTSTDRRCFTCHAEQARQASRAGVGALCEHCRRHMTARRPPWYHRPRLLGTLLLLLPNTGLLACMAAPDDAPGQLLDPVLLNLCIFWGPRRNNTHPAALLARLRPRVGKGIFAELVVPPH